MRGEFRDWERRLPIGCQLAVGVDPSRPGVRDLPSRTFRSEALSLPLPDFPIRSTFRLMRGGSCVIGLRNGDGGNGAPTAGVCFG